MEEEGTADNRVVASRYLKLFSDEFLPLPARLGNASPQLGITGGVPQPWGYPGYPEDLSQPAVISVYMLYPELDPRRGFHRNQGSGVLRNLGSLGNSTDYEEVRSLASDCTEDQLWEESAHDLMYDPDFQLDLDLDEEDDMSFSGDDVDDEDEMSEDEALFVQFINSFPEEDAKHEEDPAKRKKNPAKRKEAEPPAQQKKDPREKPKPEDSPRWSKPKLDRRASGGRYKQRVPRVVELSMEEAMMHPGRQPSLESPTVVAMRRFINFRDTKSSQNLKKLHKLKFDPHHQHRRREMAEHVQKPQHLQLDRFCQHLREGVVCPVIRDLPETEDAFVSPAGRSKGEEQDDAEEVNTSDDVVPFGSYGSGPELVRRSQSTPRTTAPKNRDKKIQFVVPTKTFTPRKLDRSRSCEGPGGSSARRNRGLECYPRDPKGLKARRGVMTNLALASSSFNSSDGDDFNRVADLKPFDCSDETERKSDKSELDETTETSEENKKMEASGQESANRSRKSSRSNNPVVEEIAAKTVAICRELLPELIQDHIDLSDIESESPTTAGNTPSVGTPTPPAHPVLESPMIKPGAWAYASVAELMEDVDSIPFPKLLGNLISTDGAWGPGDGGSAAGGTGDAAGGARRPEPPPLPVERIRTFLRGVSCSSGESTGFSTAE